MQARGRISVTWTQRWRQFRHSVLPLLTFSACVACTGWLWQHNGASPTVVGEVEAVRIDVLAGADGILLPISARPWELFDTFEEGQIIARLDDRLVKAQLEASRRELIRLREELDATAVEASLEDTERQLDHRREAARLAWELQTRRLALLDRMTIVEGDKVELRRLILRLEYLEPLLAKSAISELEVIDTRLMRDTVQRRIEKNMQGMTEARKQIDAAAKRIETFPEHVPAEVERLLAPIKAEIAVQEAVAEQLKVQIDLLEIRAPFRGMVTAIYQWPGQTVRAGEPIVAVASEEGRYVVSYVRDEQRFRPQVGMKIDVRTRHERPLLYTSHVDRVGPQVELVAQHQLRNPTIPEWGIPIRIAMPPAAQLRPGELVDVRFTHP